MGPTIERDYATVKCLTNLILNVQVNHFMGPGTNIIRRKIPTDEDPQRSGTDQV